MSYESALITRSAPSYELSRQVASPNLYKALSHLCDPVIFARGGLSVSGEENLVRNNQGQIFAANHKSNWDPFYMSKMGLKFGLQFHNLAKQELYRYKVLASLLPRLGGIAFDRDTDLLAQEAGPELGSILEAGGQVVLYTEGTRHAGEELGPMKKVGALAVRKNAIVYPTAIAGTNRRHGHVHIKIGEPFNVAGMETPGNMPRRRIEVSRQIDEQLPGQIHKLYDEAKGYLS